MNHPRVGIAVAIYNDQGNVLLGKRKGSIGEGNWAIPGGHLEFGEGLKDCAAREVFEESGIKIENCELSCVENHFIKNENKHYVSLIFDAKIYNQEPIVKEPKKCSEWKWFDLDDLPSPLFLSLAEYFEKVKNDKTLRNLTK